MSKLLGSGRGRGKYRVFILFILNNRCKIISFENLLKSIFIFFSFFLSYFSYRFLHTFKESIFGKSSLAAKLPTGYRPGLVHIIGFRNVRPSTISLI